MGCFYIAASAAMKLLLMTLTGWQVTGRDNVPATGPLIIVANHLNLIDPPLIGASLPRPVRFMAKQELFNSFFSRMVVKGYGAFPVRRGQLDRDAMRRALEYLNTEYAVGMFPEGRRSASRQLQTPQPGVSLLAHHSRAPILPVGISGSEKVKGLGFILRRPKITVRIGKPFLLPDSDIKSNRANLSKSADFIMRKIAELLPESYRGAYNMNTGQYN